MKSLSNKLVPNTPLIPAVTRTSKKMMMIWSLDNPLRMSAGVITLPSNNAVVAMKNVRDGLIISLYKEMIRKATINST